MNNEVLERNHSNGLRDEDAEPALVRSQWCVHDMSFALLRLPLGESACA